MICEKKNATNLKFEGIFTIKSNSTIKTKAIKEVVRDIDTKICESMHTNLKLKEMYNIYDIKVCNIFTKSKVIVAMIKCTYKVKLYGVRISIINNNECENECLQYSKVET